MAKYSCYAVLEGRVPGVYDTWNECSAQVTGYSGAIFKGHICHSSARYEFRLHQRRKIAKFKIRTTPLAKKKKVSTLPTSEYIVAGASYDRFNDTLTYRVVMGGTNETLFESEVYSGGNQSLGEYLALIEALKWVRENYKHDIPVLSNSMSAIIWIENKAYKGSLGIHDMDSDLYLELKKAKEYLSDMCQDGYKYSLNTLKWNNKLLGCIKEKLLYTLK